MDLHPGEEVVFEGHPSWRALLAFYAIGLGVALAAAVVLWLISGTGLGILAFVVVLAGVLVVGFVRRVATVYMISTQRLWIRRGILSKHVQQTRIDRVQNVNTEQRFIERILRVGTVDFDTAGDGRLRLPLRRRLEPFESRGSRGPRAARAGRRPRRRHHLTGRIGAS